MGKFEVRDAWFIASPAASSQRPYRTEILMIIALKTQRNHTRVTAYSRTMQPSGQRNGCVQNLNYGLIVARQQSARAAGFDKSRSAAHRLGMC
jgi:hypothetical protein